MAGDGVSGGGNIIKYPFGNMGISDEIIADGIDIVAVIDIGQIIYLGNRGPAECIYYGRPFVFGLSCDIVDQAAGKNRSFAFCSSRPDVLSFPFYYL